MAPDLRETILLMLLSDSSRSLLAHAEFYGSVEPRLGFEGRVAESRDDSAKAERLYMRLTVAV